MRSKSKKKSKKKSAYKRGEKLAIFFKRGTLLLLIMAVIASFVLAAKMVSEKFYVRDVLVSGNYHLDKKDIIDSAKIQKGDLLLNIHLKDIGERLGNNAWIKKVSLKKQFPGTLMINIKEASPKALLRVDEQLYIIDENGKKLERIKGESPPFLPVINNINSKNKKGLSEALRLVVTLSEKNIFAGRESIIIGLESYGLTMNVEGELIKVGYGDYSEKFERWMELEPEIRKKGLQIQYVDLRFKDSVIVKPVRPAKKEKTS